MKRGLYRGFESQSPSEVREPKRLALASSTVQQTGLSTPATDLTGLSVSFTVTDYPVEVELYCPWIVMTGSGGGGWIIISDLSNNATAHALWSVYVTTLYTMCIAKELITVPGSYSRKGRIERVSGTGTIDFGANLNTVVSTIKATEVRI